MINQKFEITATNPDNGTVQKFFYRTDISEITKEDGTIIGQSISQQGSEEKAATVFDLENPVGKTRDGIRTLKIQLGLSCNYECVYCSQRFVPKADETNMNDVDDFIANIEANLKLGDGNGVKVELWGGEPFVYWKTMKPLVEKLHAKYPFISFSTITNGSLLTDDKVDWMMEHGFGFAISHDGPAMKYRGPDPLDDPETRRVILRAYNMFKPYRISFNAMMHGDNTERGPIIKFFQEFTGDMNVMIGEGGLVDAYDEDGKAISLLTKAQNFDFRRTGFSEFMTRNLNNWQVGNKVQNFMSTIQNSSKYSALSQKCGMDKPENLSIDLKGNVITCQNVSIVSNNPAGTSHHAGNIADMENVKIKAATHLSKRKECPICPVVHLCKGSCMFLQGDLWEVSCNNSYSDNIVPFAYAFYRLTGHVPVWIEHPDLPDERKDVFGSMVEHEEKVVKKKFPIPVVAV